LNRNIQLYEILEMKCQSYYEADLGRYKKFI
jgi:hypothetical protein